MQKVCILGIRKVLQREGGREQTDIFEIHIAWIKLQCKTKCFRVVRMFNASLTAPAKCINIFFVDVRRILENANKTITRAISETKNGVAALIYLSEHCIGHAAKTAAYCVAAAKFNECCLLFSAELSLLTLALFFSRSAAPLQRCPRFSLFLPRCHY